MALADIRDPQRFAGWRFGEKLPRGVTKFLSGQLSTEQRLAGAAFAIRMASAGIIFASQALIARWMGSGEFGSYIYVWTWLLLASEIVHLGLPLTAQRFVPEYKEAGSEDLLRGYLSGSQWITLSISLTIAAAIGLTIWLLRSALDAQLVIPFIFACAALPAYALTFMADGLARSYNWIGLALLPAYIVRPVALVAAIATLRVMGVELNSTIVMGMLAIAAWLAVALQALRLNHKVSRVTRPGPKRYATKHWITTALPIVLVWGLYTLLTSTDVIVLKQFRSSQEVAHYYAAAKIVALVSIIYFAVAATTAHRFATLFVSSKHSELRLFAGSTVRWVFWLSLLVTVMLLLLGRWLLLMFGADFVSAYPVMVILAIGQLARAAVGPAERLLNVLGQQRKCALVYTVAFVFNISMCLLLAPVYGAIGAAVATAGAFGIESLMLFMVVKYAVGIHMFVWNWNEEARPSPELRAEQG